MVWFYLLLCVVFTACLIAQLALNVLFVWFLLNWHPIACIVIVCVQYALRYFVDALWAVKEAIDDEESIEAMRQAIDLDRN